MPPQCRFPYVMSVLNDTKLKTCEDEFTDPHCGLNAQIPWQKGHSCFQDILLWSNITMYSAAWKADGRTFERIGYYDSTGSRWYNWHNVFPNEKYRLNGRKFRVLTNIVCNYQGESDFYFIYIYILPM